MKFISTRERSLKVDFKTAVLNGIAPDGGLYMPEKLPFFDWHDLRDKNLQELASELIFPYISESFSKEETEKICQDVFDFDIPLIQVNESIYSLELFHGPTLAFKDIGARFLGRIMQEFIASTQQKHVLLVATSGDTGGAIGAAFSGIPNIEVVILYPENRISPLQELQLTTSGKNVHPFAVKGNFDHCQQLVKRAFQDQSIGTKLLSANSINCARWLIQQVYYWHGYNQWHLPFDPTFVIPSGNLGNLSAGVLAHKTGMPANHLVGATNENDAFCQFLQQHKIKMDTVTPTLSSAMDIAIPNNLERLNELFGSNMNEMKQLVGAYKISDERTIRCIQQTFKESGYIIDPHTAVGIEALKRHQTSTGSNQAGIVLSTAHPIKFKEIVSNALNTPVPIPFNYKDLTNKTPTKYRMENDFIQLKEIISNV